ncbi:MAG: glutathione S-transferase family protein [Pseudomonadota bacterium]
MTAKHEPYTLYKSDISYFSGKLEAYLRYKQIPHQPVDLNRQLMERIGAATGVLKMPAVETADGLWLFDTTPMIQWFEAEYPEPPIFPTDPALSFLALLVEDYADEWLWRPAMWWRWFPRASRWALGWRIANEFMPRVVARPFGWYFGRRQLNEWLWDDGVGKGNAEQVRDMLYREFEFLEPLLESQPYLLGSHPSIADFGYFASMFRHFGNDVESAEVMRRQAPNTYEWLARLWNARPGKLSAQQQWIWPQATFWQPLLQRICKDYLPYLHQNALAHQARSKRFDYEGETLSFSQTKTTTYRVWCRENLQQAFANLSAADQRRVEDLLADSGGLTALHQDGNISSGLAEMYELPLDPATSTPPPISLRTRLFGQARN